MEARFLGLLSGTLTREDADQWNSQWIEGESEINDRGVWQALGRLYGVSLPRSPVGYLIPDDQISTWLDEFRASAP